MLASIKKFFESVIEPEIESPARGESGLRVATAALLLEMMRMDGQIKDDERASVTAILRAQFNLTDDLVAELTALAEQEASQAHDYYQFTSLINRVCDYGQKVSIIEKLWHVAMIDGHLDVHEMHLMRKLADLLHVGHADLHGRQAAGPCIGQSSPVTGTLQPLAFVDLETTGATPTVDRITEIGIVEVSDAGVNEWSTLVDPETSIPAFIQSMTGITDAMVASAPTFGEIFEEVLERLHGRLFIAHNARFDYGFLKNEFRRAGLDFRATVLCTVKLSRRLYPGHAKHSLDALIQRHSLTVTARHRALGDARLIHQFWTLARAEHPEDRFSAALREMTARPSLPAHLDPGIADELPETSGVYLFHGDTALLYVGKAKNLRERVLSHFASDHSSAKEMSLAQQVRRIEWIETGGEIGALLKEAALIKQLQPTHNRYLRRNMELCAIRLVDHGAGLVAPQIVYARDLDFGRQAGLYGLFKSAKEATTVLFDVANAHGLCHAVLGLEKVKPNKPCFARQVRKCRGACVGEELLAAHTVRLAQALAKLKLKAWPFKGPAWLKEREEALVVDHWCYLGSARSESEVWGLLEQGRPLFDRDTYRILSKVAHKLVPME